MRARPGGRAPPPGEVRRRSGPCALRGRRPGPRGHRRDRSRAWLQGCARRRPRDRRAPNTIAGTGRRDHRSWCRCASGHRGGTCRWPLRQSRRECSRGEAARRTSGKAEGCRHRRVRRCRTRALTPDRDIRPMVSTPDGRKVVGKAPLGVEVAMGRRLRTNAPPVVDEPECERDGRHLETVVGLMAAPANQPGEIGLAETNGESARSGPFIRTRLTPCS